MKERLPSALPGTKLRVLATTDLGAVTVPLRTSFGVGGTCAGMVELLTEESERQPTVWLDAGDLVVGPLGPILGARPWAEVAELPISAAAAGNHEFDDGVPELLRAAGSLAYPLLCANVDVGLPGSTMLHTPAGALGLIGLTHPYSHRFSQSPTPVERWTEEIGPLARRLRSDGARWVVALLHDGLDWWPDPDSDDAPVHIRADRLQASTAGWADQVDLIIGGHTPCAWFGELGGTPAGHPHIWATSTLVVDLQEPAGRCTVRGVFPIPPRRPDHLTPGIRAFDAAANRIVGRSRHTWLTRTGAPYYLPDLIADAIRDDTGADAAFVPPSKHGTQSPVDGAISALPAGPVSDLDLIRLFADRDDRAVVLELAPDELGRIVAAYNASADPTARHADGEWWNWCRMPAGLSTGPRTPRNVAVMPSVVRMVSEWLDRDIDAERAGTGARTALTRWADRPFDPAGHRTGRGF